MKRGRQTNSRDDCVTVMEGGCVTRAMVKARRIEKKWSGDKKTIVDISTSSDSRTDVGATSNRQSTNKVNGKSKGSPKTKVADDDVKSRNSHGAEKQVCYNVSDDMGESTYVTDICVKPKLLWMCQDLSWCSGLDFTPENDIIVSNTGNKTLTLYDINGMQKSVICAGKIEPLGVAATEHEIFVTDAESQNVKVILREDETIKTWDVRQFKNPFGIALLTCGNIVVGDYTSNCITIHDMETGQVIRKLGDSGSQLEMKVKCPSYVCTDSHDRILVTCNGSHTVKIYDTKGEMLGEIKDDSQFCVPTGVCVESGNNNIMLACTRTDRTPGVLKFDPNGRYIEPVLTDADGIMTPYALDCTDGGLVVFREYSALKLFKLNDH